jgi:hypothetical protein
VLQWDCTLLSWGEQIPGTINTLGFGQVGMDTSGTPHAPIMGAVPGPSQTGPMAPCYIGLNFRGLGKSTASSPSPDAGPNVQLIVNLQSANMESARNIIHFSYINRYFVGTPGVSGYIQQDITHPDASYILEAPVSVGNITGSDGADIEPDKWHHLLISWDVSGNISCGGDSTAINSDFKMYYALDDKNYDKSALPASWIGDVGSDEGFGHAGNDPHTVVSNFIRIESLPWPAGKGSSSIGFSEEATPAGSYNATMGELPATEIYVPGSPNYTDGGRTVNSVYHCEMAELQIFSNLLLDTSDKTKRRAFLAPRDETDAASQLIPVRPEKTAEILGTKPDIMLHGSGKWIKGANTGTSGIGPPPESIEKPGGQFTRTGMIRRYKPDPAIDPEEEESA